MYRVIILQLVLILCFAINKSAKVAWYKLEKRGPRIEFTSNNIPKNSTYLQIRFKNVQVLKKGSIKQLPNLQNLKLNGCGIVQITPGAFTNLPQLQYLHLQDNKLEEIKGGVFNHLNVTTLSLQRNKIKIIETNAFDDMPNLFRIRLNYNRIKEWGENWFRNCPKLSEFYFRRNRISIISSKAFSHLKLDASTKIFLSKNKLNKLDPAAFTSFHILGQLWLDRNGITEIPGNFLNNLESIDVLYLARNKLIRINEGSLQRVEKVGILDVSSNLLGCLPVRLVVAANLTHLEKNNITCHCRELFEKKGAIDLEQITFDPCI